MTQSSQPPFYSVDFYTVEIYTADPMTHLSETATLRASIAATLIVAATGVGLGLASGSFAVLFEGAYSLADAMMSTLSLTVVSLITSFARPEPMPFSLKDRFNMGFWHLEPMLVALNGLLLMGVATYALLTALASLSTGGKALNFDYALAYAVITVIVAIIMAVGIGKVSRRVGSEILKLDAKAWVMTGSIASALVIAFAVGLLVQGTPWVHLAPYIDPVVLVVICVVIIPLPLQSVRQAMSDILMITPTDLKQRVDGIAASVVEEEGFETFRSYVAKVGRSRQIELYFIVRPDAVARSISAWDALRDNISDKIGGDGPDQWLTITFTEDLDWA